MKLYIPTYNRVGNIKTLDFIPPSWIGKTYVIHGPGEYHDTVCHTIETPSQIEGRLCKKRQWICDNAKDRYIFMMDDDLRFFRRDSNCKLKPATHSDMAEFFSLMEEWLSLGFPVVGASNRFMNQSLKPVYQNRLVQANYGLDLAMMQKHGVRYSDVDFIHDQHVPLSLIERGYTTQFTAEWAVAPAKMSSAGGCSSYRTVDTIREAITRFVEIHPQTARAVTGEKVKSHGLPTQMTVRINWRQAAKLAPRTDTL